MKTTTEIWTEVCALEKERRDKMRELMGQWDMDYYYPKLKELQGQCEHNWQFRDTNPLGYPIYDCSICHATRIDASE